MARKRRNDNSLEWFGDFPKSFDKSKKYLEQLDGWTKFTPYHWRRDHMGLRLDWWPTTGKWSYNGQVRMDDLKEFMFEQPRPVVKAPVKPVVTQQMIDAYLLSLKPKSLSPPCTLQELDADILDGEFLAQTSHKPSVQVFLAHLYRKRERLK